MLISPRSKASDHTVELNVSGAPLLDDEFQVTGLRIDYAVEEVFAGSVSRHDVRITRVTYLTTTDSVSIHPDYLDKPDAWPKWVAEQVEANTPEAS